MGRGVGAPLSWAAGGTIVHVLLIAGYPYAITQCGVSFATTYETGVYLDSAWHVGSSGITCKGWLDGPSGSGDEPPPIVIDESAAFTSGTFDVKSLTLVLADLSGEVTTLLGSRSSLPRSRLSATLTAAATTVDVEDTSAFASSGTAYVGREAITYTGKTGTTLTGCTRGTSGTKAQVHRVSPPHRPPAVFGSIAGSVCLPSLIGRRATLWVGRLVGTELQQPTLVYDGRIGPGISLHGPGYAIPLDHVSRALSQAGRQERITLSGYAHGGQREQAGGDTPLHINVDNGNQSVFYLGNTSGAPDNSGWHASREEFFSSFQAMIAAGLVASGLDALTLSLSSTGALSMSVTDDDATSVEVQVSASWREQFTLTFRSADAGGSEVIAGVDCGTMPEACFWFSGTLPVGALDAAKIPTLPSNPLDADTDTEGFWALVFTLPGQDSATWARITATDTNTITVLPGQVVDNFGIGHDVPGFLVTKPIGAELAVEVSSTRWDHAIRFGLLGVVATDLGVDHAEDAVEWSHLAETIGRAPDYQIFSRTSYRFLATASPLDSFQQEARRLGLALAPYRGRISAVPLYDAAPTEESGATITTDDLDPGAVPRLSEVSQGLVTRMKLSFPNGDSLTAVDMAAEDELGRGETMEVLVPPGTEASALRDASAQAALLAHAQLCLGPWSEPYRVVTLRLTQEFSDVQVGDVVDVSTWLIPDGAGGRAVSSRRCLCIGRRLDLTGGTVELDLRLGDSTLAGYAPEVMVGGISGAVVTVDVTWLGTQGIWGFSDRYKPDGTARADGGAGWFAAGFKVMLHELDATAPAAPWSGEVLSVSGTTITLTGSPGAAWETLAATAGKVLLAFDGYAIPPTAVQKRYAYIADSTFTIGSDAARRYS